MKKVLITGGVGFIGQHLRREAHRREFSVRVFDYANDIDDDVRDEDSVMNTFAWFEPDLVIHAAALASVRDSMKTPRAYAETNVLGTINVALACARYKAPMINISSGGTVYGHVLQYPISRDTEMDPIDVYGASKASAEWMVRSILTAAHVPYWSLRYPNVYGPGQNPDGEAGVVAIFSKQMLQNQPVTVRGDGHQFRDFMFVRDVARVTFDAVNMPNGSYNVGTGKATSVLQMFRMLADITGYDRSETFGPAGVGEVRGIVLEPSWPQGPYAPMMDALRDTVSWVRNTL